MRDQKRSIVQSSIDKNLYFRDGDDAWTSGVSASSTDNKDNKEENKESANLSKSDSENQLIWYAAYDSEMRNEVFEDLLYQCSDKTNPRDKVSIKLENFDIVFSQVSNLPGMVYLQQRTWGSWFIKLYLITKGQLLDIAKTKTFAYTEENLDFSMLNTLLIYNKESAVIDTNLPYGYFLRIGEYEETSIYTLTNFSLQLSSDIKNAWDPTDFYIKEFFKAMTESFPNFSSDFLLYYINSKKGLKNKLSSQLMIELREFGTLKDR